MTQSDQRQLVIASRYPDLAVCLYGVPYLAVGGDQVKLFGVDCFTTVAWEEVHFYGWYSLAMKAKLFMITKINENLIRITGEVTALPGQYISPAPTNCGNSVDWLKSQVQVDTYVERVFLEGYKSPSYFTMVYPH